MNVTPTNTAMEETSIRVHTLMITFLIFNRQPTLENGTFLVWFYRDILGNLLFFRPFLNSQHTMMLTYKFFSTGKRAEGYVVFLFSVPH